MYFADWDKRLCAESRAVVAAARQGEFAMRRLLNEPSVKGGIARGETLLATRVTACLSAAGVLSTSVNYEFSGDAPTGGPDIQQKSLAVFTVSTGGRTPHGAQAPSLL